MYTLTEPEGRGPPLDRPTEGSERASHLDELTREILALRGEEQGELMRRLRLRLYIP